VIIKDEKGEHLYRYGDISRSAAKDDTQAYRMYACNKSHIFTQEKPGDNAALLNATVVKPGDPRFLEVDAKYLSSCTERVFQTHVHRRGFGDLHADHGRALHRTPRQQAEARLRLQWNVPRPSCLPLLIA
jgi:hypothetical protein